RSSPLRLLLLAWLVLALASLQGVSLHKHVDHHGHAGGLHLAQAPDHQPHHDATEEVEISGLALPVLQASTKAGDPPSDADAEALLPRGPILAQRPERAVDLSPTEALLPRVPDRRISLPRGPPA
ncbi:MAG: hypothetical protein ACQERG_05245, partial [Pseudomonadota bacterium]